MDQLTDLRENIAARRSWSEDAAIADNAAGHGLSADDRAGISSDAAALVDQLRAVKSPGLMEAFLGEYGLSTDEGVALMCLAEAYLRTPDARSLDALIRDKIGPGDWGSHRAGARSLLVNASTWALMLTGRLFRDEPEAQDGLLTTMRLAVRRLGEPVARTAVEQAMKVMGRQFVLGRNIDEALDHGAAQVKAGYTYSFDMLGEAARTDPDARRYLLSYAKAISAIADRSHSTYVHENPGISVKLSALHPRFEEVQRGQVLDAIVPRLLSLAVQARAANIGLSLDAEEADRLELTLDIYEAVLRNPDLEGWDGFGLVVQAYQKQAPAVLRWLYALAQQTSRKMPVRLVKGAYWDAEIKNAQVLGLATYPVFTRKAATDLSFLRCARLLLDGRDWLFPQFATHNAHTATAILHMAGSSDGFEFQRLHGMGNDLHQRLRDGAGRPCRIYAPVGVHKDLLAYLVRRLLENGANSSFVNQLLDEQVPTSQIARDPLGTIETLTVKANPNIPLPRALYGASRINSMGINLNNRQENAVLDMAMAPFRDVQWHCRPMVAGVAQAGDAEPVVNPSIPAEEVGTVVPASPDTVDRAITLAVESSAAWRARMPDDRAAILERVAELYEANMPELIALGCREAGKTRLDGVLEVREAVDFCRYYAADARRVLAGGDRAPLGVVACISPWNFPLAIFTGQVAAALVAGNTVLAKPAEQTPLMAAKAVDLMYQAGVPAGVLSLLPGKGPRVGDQITADPRVGCCCFTGSIQTAALIDRALATRGDPEAPLIAETGGLNAMIVDSTALPEQAVRDIVQSAFQSAGQRCSALRVLFLQEDVADAVLTMLEGAARGLSIGDPWDTSTDVGPVIDAAAKTVIQDHCQDFADRDRMLFRVPIPKSCATGTYVSPCAIRLEKFKELKQEIFGPVLHVVTYRADELGDVVTAINDAGYGLTLGIHSRIDRRLDRVCSAARVGNIYINRNQIGAVVGVQPFGGEGLSGTGPKAGGPDYLYRFTWPTAASSPNPEPWVKAVADGVPEEMILPGPTGERNTLIHAPRGPVACLGSGDDADEASFKRQVDAVLESGNTAVLADSPMTRRLQAEATASGRPEITIQPGSLIGKADDLGIRAVLFDGDRDQRRAIRKALASRDGVRIPVLPTNIDVARWLRVERVISEDTTASGGNATLLAQAEAGIEG